MGRILQHACHTVRMTGDFKEATQWLQHSVPDLVITNVSLRGIAGHDAMLELKRDFPKMPVLMVTGLPDEKIIRDWTGKIGFDVFPKSFRCDSFLEKGRQMIAGSQVAHPPDGQ